MIEGHCIGCFHDFTTGPCGGCGARPGRSDLPARIDIALTEALTDPANHPYGARMPNVGGTGRLREALVEALVAVVRTAQAQALHDAADNLTAYPEVQTTLRARADRIDLSHYQGGASEG